MRKSIKWALPIVTAVLVAGVGLSAASIANENGTAKLTGQVGTLQPVTGTGGTFTGDLWPGHSNGCTVSIDNPNSVDVKVTKLVIAGVHVATGPNVGDYTPAQYSAYATFPDITPTNFVVGAHTTGTQVETTCITLADQDDTSQQGTQIAAHYTVSVSSN